MQLLGKKRWSCNWNIHFRCVRSLNWGLWNLISNWQMFEMRLTVLKAQVFLNCDEKMNWWPDQSRHLSSFWQNLSQFLNQRDFFVCFVSKSSKLANAAKLAETPKLVLITRQLSSVVVKDISLLNLPKDWTLQRMNLWILCLLTLNCVTLYLWFKW